MINKKIKITVGNREKMAKEFIAAWHKVEAGKAFETLEEKIYFKDDRALFKVISPKRCELLRLVHEYGKITILALAKKLARDYRNVHKDVKELSQIGLMIKDEETGKYNVPWNSIVTEIPLSTTLNNQVNHFRPSL